MNVQRISGLLLIVAAASFLIGWVLMPDAGTVDAAHILEVVSIQRSAVWWSVVLHLICSVALVTAVLGIQTSFATNMSRIAIIGAWLVLVGALGVCADAFFHLIAYYMTANEVGAHAAIEPMRLLQTQGVVFLAPMLLALIAGAVVYPMGLWRSGVTTAWPYWLGITAIAVATAGGVVVASLGQGRQTVVLVFLTLIAFPYGWIGYDIVLSRQ